MDWAFDHALPYFFPHVAAEAVTVIKLKQSSQLIGQFRHLTGSPSNLKGLLFGLKGDTTKPGL